jgi:translocation protein SEC72
MASPQASTSALVYHDLSIGNPALLQAVSVPANATPETVAAIHALNVFARDMAAGNVLIPGIPQALTANPRSERITQAKETGNKLLKTAKPLEAIDKYTLAASLAATRPVFEASGHAREELAVLLNNRAAAYLSAKKWVEALADAEAVIKLKRATVKAHFRKGRALLGMERFEDAREAYLLGLEFDPSNEVRCVAWLFVRPLLVLCRLCAVRRNVVRPGLALPASAQPDHASARPRADAERSQDLIKALGDLDAQLKARQAESAAKVEG